MDVALVNKNYAALVSLFEKYDVGLLFDNGFARDRNKNKLVVSFDLINRLLWVFADMMDGRTAELSKVVEWMCLLLENVSTKDLDFDINALLITLGKMEENVSRISPTELRIKM